MEVMNGVLWAAAIFSSISSIVMLRLGYIDRGVRSLSVSFMVFVMLVIGALAK